LPRRPTGVGVLNARRRRYLDIGKLNILRFLRSGLLVTILITERIVIILSRRVPL
jgi:hypothetical protein